VKPPGEAEGALKWRREQLLSMVSCGPADIDGAQEKAISRGMAIFERSTASRSESEGWQAGRTFQLDGVFKAFIRVPPAPPIVTHAVPPLDSRQRRGAVNEPARHVNFVLCAGPARFGGTESVSCLGPIGLEAARQGACGLSRIDCRHVRMKVFVRPRRPVVEVLAIRSGNWGKTCCPARTRFSKRRGEGKPRLSRRSKM